MRRNEQYHLSACMEYKQLYLRELFRLPFYSAETRHLPILDICSRMRRAVAVCTGLDQSHTSR